MNKGFLGAGHPSTLFAAAMPAPIGIGLPQARMALAAFVAARLALGMARV